MAAIEMSKHAPLDEAGYQKVAALRDNEAMKLFIRRLVSSRGGLIICEGGLSGFTPYFSGLKAVQSFAKLVASLGEERHRSMVFLPSEEEYQRIARLRDNDAMKVFIRRVVTARNGRILSEPMLSGFAPWYSGVSATQSFARLLQELHEAKLSGMVSWAEAPKPGSGPPAEQGKGGAKGGYGQGGGSHAPSPTPESQSRQAPPVVAWAGPHHIHLSWDDSETPDIDQETPRLYHVYSSATAEGPFSKLTVAKPLPICTYCDPLGPRPQSRFYYITLAASSDHSQESDRSNIVTATTTGDAGMNDDNAFLDFIQRAHIEYFRAFAEPHSGAARETFHPFKPSGAEETGGAQHPPQLISMGGTGIGIANIIVGVARGFIQRTEACRRLLRLLVFLEKADRFHGIWPHWLWGPTGKVQPFSALDDGADLPESCMVFQSLLIARAFFDGTAAAEVDMRMRITRLWEAAEFSHFVKDGKLMWHWSPKHGFKLGLAITGFNEAQICYLLGVSHPKHPIAPAVYASGWVNGNSAQYKAALQNGATPLFWTHLSYYGFDPKWADRFCDNYFEIMSHRTQVHIDHADRNPKGYPDYGASKLWGLSACFTKNGYEICSPSNDTGVVAPFASCSAYPYKSAASISAMKHMYKTYGSSLWSSAGFKDSICPGTEPFTCQLYVALDQSTVAPMIENGRTGLLWSLFMASEEAKLIQERLGKQ